MDHQLIYRAEQICNGANIHCVRTYLQQYIGASQILEDEKDKEVRRKWKERQEKAEANIRKEIGKANRTILRKLRE